MEELMEDDIAGCPVSSIRWSRRSTYRLSEELMEEYSVRACPSSVGYILKANAFSLRANRKCIAETYHPDRNRQFEIITATRKRFEDAGHPIISIDSKKKEKIGNFKNPGRTWRTRDEKVFDHDFGSYGIGIAAPYGIFEPLYNIGTLVIGKSFDTAEFAVDCIDLWLSDFASKRYQRIEKLLILCDSGGSNGARIRLWKFALYHGICQKYGTGVCT